MHMLIVEMDCKPHRLKSIRFDLKRWGIELENYHGQWRALVPTHSYHLTDPVGFVFNIINQYCASCYVNFWPTVHRRQTLPPPQPEPESEIDFAREWTEEEDFERFVYEGG